MATSTFPGAKTVNTSLWWGGDGKSISHASWLPYWANGNVPLLALLKAAGPSALGRLDPDAAFEQVVPAILEYILGHTHTNRSDPAFGWIGPYDSEPGDDNGYGLWEPLNTLRALFAYAESEPSAARRVAAAVVAHLTAEAKLLKTDPVYKWASTRWPTFVQCCLYVIDHYVPLFGSVADVMPLGAAGTTSMLLNASRVFMARGMDWDAYYSRTGDVKFPLGPVYTWNTNDHGVNNAEGALAWPAMAYRLTGNLSEAQAQMRLVLHMIDEYQAQPNALLCSDEVFCGRAPHRGTESALLAFELGTSGTPHPRAALTPQSCGLPSLQRARSWRRWRP